MPATLPFRIARVLLLATVLGGLTPPAAAAEASTPPAAPPDAKWIPLFDGQSLAGWKLVTPIDFEDHGPVIVRDGCLVLSKGKPATGVQWTRAFPKNDYELALEAMRTEGDDFFCGLTFPVGNGALTLVVGGWGNCVTGLSCLDGERAEGNETCTPANYKNDRWYRVRVRVTDPKVQVWIDGEQIIDLKRGDQKLSVSLEMEPCLPLGVATWYTTGKLRNFRYRTLGAAAGTSPSTAPKTPK